MSNLPEMLRNPWVRDLDRFFDQVAWPSLRRGDADFAKQGFNPSCEVSEDKTGYHLKFDLPGIPKDQIKIDLHENQLTVSGERRSEKKEENKRQHFSEVFYGSFSRSLTFPSSVDAEKVSASYENGILNIMVPKSEASRTKQITIK
jgi:HSP20 family protein